VLFGMLSRVWKLPREAWKASVEQKASEHSGEGNACTVGRRPTCSEYKSSTEGNKGVELHTSINLAIGEERAFYRRVESSGEFQSLLLLIQNKNSMSKFSLRLA